MSYVQPARPAGRKRRQSSYRATLSEFPELGHVHNITNVYRRADADTVAAGSGWYAVAHNIAHEQARRYGLTFSQCAGIIAALSPSTAWGRNVTLAETMCSTGDASHPYGLCIDRARAIRNGGHAESILGGRKVRSFYANIVSPTVAGTVTIDRHAVAAAWGTVHVPDKILERAGAYQRVAGAYRTAARQLELLPHQLQAIVWVQWRQETGADVHDYTGEEF